MLWRNLTEIGYAHEEGLVLHFLKVKDIHLLSVVDFFYNLERVLHHRIHVLTLLRVGSIVQGEGSLFESRTVLAGDIPLTPVFVAVV